MYSIAVYMAAVFSDVATAQWRRLGERRSLGAGVLPPRTGLLLPPVQLPGNGAWLVEVSELLTWCCLAVNRRKTWNNNQAFKQGRG